ncbi:hypothetical protein [Oceanicola sp. 502str15]|uniref:hypothetical protein n=1 Tax=Oceanicola sp. 502str15 TaxID=2696061 RepID=UPI0020942DD3|nr:hypothetical protein [Oceanicola sp. 502str15]MCO6384225.1 hypothetical protein [Oceanicola sp. 502str15]
MRKLALIAALLLVAAPASADLMQRYEAADEAVMTRFNALIGQKGGTWSEADRRGRTCLMAELQKRHGARAVSGAIRDLERVAAKAGAARDASGLAVEKTMVLARNGIPVAKWAPVAQACKTSF